MSCATCHCVFACSNKDGYKNKVSNGINVYFFNMKYFVTALLCAGVFCFTEAQAQTGGRKSNTNNLERQERQAGCTCGIRNGAENRIVNGKEAGVNEFPWRVALLKQQERKCQFTIFGPMCYTPRSSFFCGASLISNNWVMTAAHCVKSSETSTYRLRLGAHDLSKQNEPNSVERRASKVIVHPNWSSATMDNDIALIRLDQPVAYSRAISPICLPIKQRTNSFESGQVVATGWGTTSSGGGGSGTVNRKVVLDLTTRAKCNFTYPGHITNNMVCAYTETKDTCQGDSGGSIDYLDRGQTTRFYSAAGIVSFGKRCAEKDAPGVYTKVNNYLDWIRQQTGESYCNP